MFERRRPPVPPEFAALNEPKPGLLGLFIATQDATAEDVARYYYESQFNLGILKGHLEANCRQGWLR